MAQRPKTLGFAFLLTLLAALHVVRSADAASVSRQCRRACRDQIAACVAGGGRARSCRKSLLEHCKREGVAVCGGQAGQISAALAGDCSSPTVIPAPGGTFSGTTSGTSALAGSCGRSGESPEQVFQGTPTVSGTATIQTCGAATTFDTVLYLRSGVCSGGPEVAAGCNDDTCPNATGLFRASRITPTVTAGQTYFIVVDGYGGAQGTFSLTVTAPVATTTTTTVPTTTSTSTTTTLPTRTTTTTSTTTTTPPPTTQTTTPPTTTTTATTLPTTSTTSTTTTPTPTTTSTSTTTTRPPTTTTTLPTTSTTSTTTTLPPTTTTSTPTTTTTTTTTPPDTTAPSVPTGLSTVAGSCSQINVGWAASTETGGSGLK